MPDTIPCPYCGTLDDDNLTSHVMGCPTRKYMENPDGYEHVQALGHWLLGYHAGSAGYSRPPFEPDPPYELGFRAGEAQRKSQQG